MPWQNVEIAEETDNEDEEALMELVEYVRIGTITIFDKVSPGVYPRNEKGVLH